MLSRIAVVSFLVVFSIHAKEGDEKKRFLSELMGDDHIDYGITFSPSGDTFYFARAKGTWGKKIKSSIYYAKNRDGQWSEPKIVSFSGRYDDSDPHIDLDGRTLYFVSDRPSKGGNGSPDIWVVEKDSAGNWGQPERLPEPINSTAMEASPKTTQQGDLYFVSNRKGGLGQGDIYRAGVTQQGFSQVENLGRIVNAPTGEWNFDIDPAGEILIFEASHRKHNMSVSGDLYISFKQDETWTIPQNIVELNSKGSDLYAKLSNDHRLYYSSNGFSKDTSPKIYQTDFNQLISQYQKTAQKPHEYMFVVNRSDHVVVLLDLQTQEIVKKIAVGKGPHEIAISGDGGHAFVANYGFYPGPQPDTVKWFADEENTITKINLFNFETETFTVPESTAHHGILANEDGSKVWVTVEEQGLVKELDGQSGEVIASYKTMKGSHIVVATPNISHLFASNIESNTVSAINLLDKTVQHISTPKGPEGLAISPDGKYLWVLCNQSHQIMVIEIATLKPVNTFASQGKFPVKMAFVDDQAWVVNVFSKDIAIFNSSNFRFMDKIMLETTPLGIVDSDAAVYVSTPRKDQVIAIDKTTLQINKTIDVGLEPDGMVVIQSAPLAD